MLRILIVSLFYSYCLYAADSRKWTNPEGTKSFDAEYISRNGNEITLKRSDGKEITFNISKLHKDDSRWLNLNHPAGDSGKLQETPEYDAIFDSLKFGDTHEDVIQKLERSAIIVPELQDTLFGRTGLYRTKNKVGGLYCYLFYDFDETGHLYELTMRTEAQPKSQYRTTVRSCWEELPRLISILHGRPAHSGNMAAVSSLKEGDMLGSHVWRMESGGNIILGIAMVEGKYEVAVRFTLEEVEMHPLP